MSVMEQQDRNGDERSRRRYFNVAMAAAGLGVVALGVGFVFGAGGEGDTATGFGVMAGAGTVALLGGGLVAWLNRPGATPWMTGAGQTRRDRLQAERAWQLSLFPLVGMIFLALAIGPARDLLNGEAAFRHYLSVMLPVLYAWVTAAIAMGWDGQSRKHRKYLEDELTVVLRARAITLAFVVLMIGSTVALALCLYRIEFGVLALLAALTAAGATAGVRFAWLDREAGRDG
jgi:hypothetical protein